MTAVPDAAAQSRLDRWPMAHVRAAAVAFLWPFVVAPGRSGRSLAAAPIFGALLLLVLAIVFAEIAEGGIDARRSRCSACCPRSAPRCARWVRAPPGSRRSSSCWSWPAGCSARASASRLGSTSLFASALLTGGVGPWLPYQMFGCAWVGLVAGLLPAARGRAEILMLAAYGAVVRLRLRVPPQPVVLAVLGRTRPARSPTCPGASFTEQWHRYLVFDATTSLGWDTGRAVTNFVCILVVGPTVLGVLRRAARRAAFEAPIAFEPA